MADNVPDISPATASPRRRSRWRIIRTIAICLLLGAIMNIAVAWSLAAWLPQTDWDHQAFRGRESTGFFEGVVIVDQARSLGACRRERRLWDSDRERTIVSKVAGTRYRDMGPMMWPAWGRAELARWSDTSWGIEHATGWPVLAAWYEVRHLDWNPPTYASVGPQYELLGGFEVAEVSGRKWQTDWRALPLRPIWPGLIINTLFYAALSWSLWLIPLTLRRARRRRRNLCLRCGYPRAGITTDAACPECGARA